MSPRLSLEPVGLVAGAEAGELTRRGRARALAGGPLAFTAVILAARVGRGAARRVTLTIAELDRWTRDADPAAAARVEVLLERLAAPRPGAPSRPRLMGIVNATPDSFSDGGEALEPAAAVARGLALAAEGADIVDVGGESTRPGATPVRVGDELARVVPVVEGLHAARADLHGALISIDTRRAEVMRAALGAGADMVNDVSALGAPGSLALVASGDAPVVLMHAPGPGDDLHRGGAYADVARDVLDHLEARVEACVAAGVGRERLIVDPGVGFGKRGAQSRAVLRSLALYHSLGCPVLVGLSRKGLGLDRPGAGAPRDRLPASLAGAVLALERGVQILRVHDVAQTRQALDLWIALRCG